MVTVLSTDELWQLAFMRWLIVISKKAPATRLPESTRIKFQRRQPTMPPAGRIDTHGETQVQNFAIGLLCMSDNDRLARHVRPHFIRFK